MEQLFTDILQHIATSLPWVSLVDEDYGQLQTDEDTYPVTFPCVLISTPTTTWENLGPTTQQGVCRVAIKLAIDCYDDTHYGSGTESKAAERLLRASELHKQLQGQRPKGAIGMLSRKESRDYSLPGNIKVYERVYEVRVKE